MRAHAWGNTLRSCEPAPHFGNKNLLPMLKQDLLLTERSGTQKMAQKQQLTSRRSFRDNNKKTNMTKLTATLTWFSEVWSISSWIDLHFETYVNLELARVKHSKSFVRLRKVFGELCKASKIFKENLTELPTSCRKFSKNVHKDVKIYARALKELKESLQSPLQAYAQNFRRPTSWKILRSICLSLYKTWERYLEHLYNLV